jgi:PilZ domain
MTADPRETFDFRKLAMSNDRSHNRRSEMPSLRQPNGSYRPRRRWQRLPLAIPIFVRGTNEHGKVFEDFATALNLSAGGLLLVSQRPLRVGSVVDLEIPSSIPNHHPFDKPPATSLPARVVYAAFAEGIHQCGMAFIHPLLDARENELD